MSTNRKFCMENTPSTRSLHTAHAVEKRMGGERESGAVLHPSISSILLPCGSQPEHPRAPTPGSWDSGAGVGGICGSSSQSRGHSRKSLERAWFGAVEGALM